MSHDNPNFQALDWLGDEINATLVQARQQLEAFASDSSADPLPLQNCLELIHQVHGSLHMAELAGAAMLAEEMEQLVQALASGDVENSQETQEFLMRALLELPLYLEKAVFQRRDTPVLLLPLLNDLRAVRRERLITEGALFSPDLSPLQMATGEHPALTGDSAKLTELVGKLRKMYHVAGAGLIRDVNGGESLAYLVKVAEKMSLLYSGSIRRPLWQILLAIFEAIGEHRINVMPALRQLLRRIDVEFRLLQGRGARVLDAGLDRDLVRNLLFYVFLAGPNGPRCQSIYGTFALDRAVPGTPRPDTQDALAMGPEALGTVIAALREEVQTVRDALEPNSGTGESPPLAATVAVAKRLADTLGVLGLEDQRARARRVYESVRDASRTADNQDLLMRAAAELVQLDASLGAVLARKVHEEQPPLMGDATDTVVREVRAELETVKESIVEFIASHWDQSYLARVPGRLQEVLGGLEMAGYGRAANIVSACRRYICEQLMASAAEPEWKVLDTLADAIASVDYYLERRAEGAEEATMLLALAEDSVAALGFAVAEEVVPVNAGADAEIKPLSSGAQSADSGGQTPTTIFAEEVAPDVDTAPVAVAESVQTEDSDGAVAGDDLSTEVGDPYQAPALPTGAHPAGEVPPAAVPEEDSDSLIDEEILAIFLEEAGEVLDTIGEYFPQWASDFTNLEALREFRRGFHTLKGSGRMVEALEIGELAWAVENMLNRVLDKTVKSHKAQVELIELVRQKLPSMVDAFRRGSGDPDPRRTAQLEDWAGGLARGEVPPGLLAASAEVSAVAALDLDATTDALEPEPVPQGEVDDEMGQLWEIFAQEAETHLATVAEFLREMRAAAPIYGVPSDPLHRALHTLKGSAHMAEVTPVAQIIGPLERFAKELRTYQVSIDGDVYELISDGADYVREVLAQIRAGDSLLVEKSEQFLARVAELQERAVGHLIREREASEPRAVDPQLLAVIMADGMRVLLDADQMLSQWRAHPGDTSILHPVVDELRILHQAAEQAQLPTLAELAQLLLQVYCKVIDGHLEEEPALWAALEQGHNELLDLVDAVAAAQDLPPVSVAVGEALRNLAQDQSDLGGEDDYDWSELGIDADTLPQAPGFEAGDSHRQTGEDGRDWEIETLPDRAESGPAESFATAAVPLTQASEEPVAPAIEVDPDVVDVFMEEAGDLVEELEELIQGWEQLPADDAVREALKRALHTFKGGARMAGLMGLGEVAHRFESVIEGMQSAAEPPAEFFTDAHAIYDCIAGGLETVRAWMAGEQLDAFNQLLSTDWADEQLAQDADPEDYGLESIAPEQVADEVTAPVTGDEAPGPESGAGLDEIPALVQSPQVGAEPAGNVLPFVRRQESQDRREATAPSRSQPQEMVRVAAELLEELVNLAGETSISRGRLEEQMSDFGLALEEMDSTLLRLNEQLRRLDLETEAQVLFRQEQLAEHDDEFDPLEMDRYSSIQQLSRSLLESTSDLMELRTTLNNKARDTETLLLQQSRVNTELQEGLMRSRMVPFSRLVPRLRRIVRQVSSELGKQVDLVFSNVEGELDRSMLERMVAPLEHMLRNAVDHGIELPDVRAGSGKPERGRIDVVLKREGSEVVITIGDDGGGINLHKVRQKAVEKGLMRPEAELSDNEILQFILQAGFSTAEQVTQISGRGVGMDVVSAEIKQIGGSVNISSKQYIGTQFVVRLPFTVSVNRALMVRVGEDLFALPLNTIEGIVRLSPFELEHYYRSEEAHFDYAGESYSVSYFGALLKSGAQPKLGFTDMRLPVLLVRSEGHAMALQVDAIMGSREIVVKSLGPQFASVQGVSGATVMGDGTVVVILDAHALLRQWAVQQARPQMPTISLEPPSEPEPDQRQREIMVVDDSVTVRKVTSRFLEREGFVVATAKDGQDAVFQLQDHIPDLILLDIEMPRMDGFEVARHIRSSSRLKDIPIIMITSRTGQKHRDHATSLGVNHYLGKPYQEEVLLETIREYIAEAATA
ncbi:hybrid sensor histidine kinase/response regulator [Microbulbifer sp. 2201CG32-9]|uniref:hybrid sensor histidine kinase/response regulator n=1 Tax=Microbulbifer sp. 2201CG32-9 TaxID=3232309 RepID=UPI00345C5E1F